MTTFSQETKKSIFEAQHEYCKHCLKKIVDFHHRLPNNKPNQKLFPLFLQSPFNCLGICRDAHDGPEKEVFKITLSEATIYENWLTKLKEGQNEI